MASYDFYDWNKTFPFFCFFHPYQEKKEQEERERQQRLAEGVKESANHVRNLEAANFEKLLKEHDLQILEVWLILKN